MSHEYIVRIDQTQENQSDEFAGRLVVVVERYKR